MSWLRLDDGFYDHEKVSRLSPAAGWLWVRALGWSAKHLRDGALPEHVARWLAGGDPAPLAEELVGSGLWEKLEGGGWRAHDFTDYNPSADQVLSRRKAASERMARGRSSSVRTNTERTDAHSPTVRANSEGTGTPPPTVRTNFAESVQRTSPNVLAELPRTNAEQVSDCSPVPARPGPSQREQQKPPSGAVAPSAATPAAEQGELQGVLPEPMPFTVKAAFGALTLAAGGRFVAGRVDRKYGPALTSRVRQNPDLALWELLGAWWAAGGGGYRTDPYGPTFVASGAFNDAMAAARAWDSAGRPAVSSKPRQAPQRGGYIPAPPPEVHERERQRLLAAGAEDFGDCVVLDGAAAFGG